MVESPRGGELDRFALRLHLRLTSVTSLASPKSLLRPRDAWAAFALQFGSSGKEAWRYSVEPITRRSMQVMLRVDSRAVTPGVE